MLMKHRNPLRKEPGARMKPSVFRASLILGSIGLMIAAWFVVAPMQPELASIHKKIEAYFQSVQHIDADGYVTLDSEQVVVFDVREPDEFAVSHLAGAIQLKPDISPEAFARQFKDTLSGKTVVFYCSVGWRSSDLAQRVDSVLVEQGVVASYNLTGGLFQWHNEERPLMSEAGNSTNAIHPYNAFWGSVIDDQSAIQYSPLLSP